MIIIFIKFPMMFKLNIVPDSTLSVLRHSIVFLIKIHLNGYEWFR